MVVDHKLSHDMPTSMQGQVLIPDGMQVDLSVLSSNGSKYDALNATFFVRDSSAISYGNTLVPPLRKAVTEWLTDPQHVSPSAWILTPPDPSTSSSHTSKTQSYSRASHRICAAVSLAQYEDVPKAPSNGRGSLATRATGLGAGSQSKASHERVCSTQGIEHSVIDGHVGEGVLPFASAAARWRRQLRAISSGVGAGGWPARHALAPDGAQEQPGAAVPAAAAAARGGHLRGCRWRMHAAGEGRPHGDQPLGPRKVSILPNP